MLIIKQCHLSSFQPPPSPRTGEKRAWSSKFSSDHQVSVLRATERFETETVGGLKLFRASSFAYLMSSSDTSFHFSPKKKSSLLVLDETGNEMKGKLRVTWSECCHGLCCSACFRLGVGVGCGWAGRGGRSSNVTNLFGRSLSWSLILPILCCRQLCENYRRSWPRFWRKRQSRQYVRTTRLVWLPAFYDCLLISAVHLHVCVLVVCPHYADVLCVPSLSEANMDGAGPYRCIFSTNLMFCTFPRTCSFH